MGKRRILTAKGPRRGMLTSRVVMRRELHEGQLRMYYFEAGVGAPLVMLHGLGGSSRWWFPLFPELSSASLRLIAPDLPGFGRSPGPLLGIADAARAVIKLVDRMGLAHFFLCGHSMGGAVAAQIAADYGGRVRRLVLVDTAGIPGVGPERLLGRIAQPWSWCPLRFYSTFIGDVLKAGPRNMLNAAHELRRYDIRPNLDRIRAPALVIWGEKDGLTPLEHGRRIAAGLPDGRLETIPGARHLPMVSAPDVVSRLIVRFLGEDFKTEA
ncbi:MAG: alpha/beta fold hydrolase [Gemmatimonadota bacterium]|nr:MAG: alpha/beta fold hydrolase [Gemmatimonadota bacterium]